NVRASRSSPAAIESPELKASPQYSTGSRKYGKSWAQAGEDFGVIATRPTVHFSSITIQPASRGGKIHDGALGSIGADRVQLDLHERGDVDDLIQLLDRRPDLVHQDIRFQSAPVFQGLPQEMHGTYVV